MEPKSRWRKWVETNINRLCSEMNGKAKFEADRVTTIMDEIDELREQMEGLAQRVDRMAAFLNQMRREAKEETAQ